jgi:hypothetical protein
MIFQEILMKSITFSVIICHVGKKIDEKRNALWLNRF